VCLPVCLVLFYPVVPLFAHIRLLWKRPKNLHNVSDSKKSSEEMRHFNEVKSTAPVAQAIAGGIESPVQIILQVVNIYESSIRQNIYGN
jgi:hypothetical protein